MSCNEYGDDLVLSLLEALASAHGLRLVPVEAEQASDYERRQEALKAEFEAMGTDYLLAHLIQLEVQSSRLYSATQAWEKVYVDRAKRIAGANLPGTRQHDYSPSNQPPKPPALQQMASEVSNAVAMARAVLAVRIANEALAEIMGTATAEEALAKLKDAA